MASISTDPRGNRRILFIIDEKRRSIRLGKLAMKQAEAIKLRVEIIIASKMAGQPVDTETSAWLARCGDDLYAKLAAVGLAPARESAVLGPFIAAYIAGRTDIVGRTRLNLRTEGNRLIEFFGADRLMRNITPADADNFVIWMKGKYAGPTTSRNIKRARQFYRAAIRGRLLTEDPFEHIKPGSMANPDRQFHVPRESVAKVLDKCPDANWRLIVALSRYGGLRCPSEVLELQWADVDWSAGRFVVRSQKTGNREVPIFPELRPFLVESFEVAEPGAIYVISKYRGPDINLRTTFAKIIRKAGLESWDRPFHNMRASRETELAAEYPLHVVCSWIGNSPKVAEQHYLTVREDDFTKAAKGSSTPSGSVRPPVIPNTPTEPSGADTGAQVAQKATLAIACLTEPELQHLTVKLEEYRLKITMPIPDNSCQTNEFPDQGMNYLKDVNVFADSENSDVKTGAFSIVRDNDTQLVIDVHDAELILLIKAWERLPGYVRDRLAEMACEGVKGDGL